MSANRRDNNRPEMRGVTRKAKEPRPDKKINRELRKGPLPVRTKNPALRRKSLRKR